MVRTLDANLLSSLNSNTRCPAISLTIEDHVIHYSPYQTPSVVDAWHDTCLASDNSIVRVQLPRTGSGFVSNFQVQRITDPAQSSQWSTWITLPGSAALMFQDGGCALANFSGTLYAFAQRGTGGNNLWAWSSTNNGATWSGPVTVLNPPGGALIKGLSSAGNNDLFFLYDVLGGEALGCTFLSAGSWSALTTWTFSPLALSGGLAATWTGSFYTLIYSDGYSLTSCTFNPATTTWTSGVSIVPSTNTAIVRFSPRLSFADGLYTLSCVEADAGLLTGSVYSYPRLRQSRDLLHWSQGQIIPDLACHYGVFAFKLPVPQSGSSGARYYLATLATVYSTPVFQTSNAAQYLDLSAAILSYQRHEQLNRPARLEVVIDNAQGVYNAAVSLSSSYQPIGLNASLVLSEGYRVGTPPVAHDVVRVGTYHLQQIRFVRAPQENQLILTALDLSANLDLLSRYQINYINQPLSYLITEVCARAGLFSISLPTTSQMSQLVPLFLLPANLSYRHALDELVTTYGLSYFLDQNEVLQFRELSSSDPVTWTYQPEIESVSFSSNAHSPNHLIVSGKPPVGGLLGSLTTAEVSDNPRLHQLGYEHLLYHHDTRLITTTQCSQKAAFLLAQAQRAQFSHTVTIPLNPALQMYDVINLIDSIAPTGSGQQATCRITSLLIHYDAAQALAELQLTLEGL